jgi:hypothetical protein
MHFSYMGQLVTGQNQGLAMIYRAVQSQAMMLARNSIYHTLAGVMIIAIALCFLLPRAQGEAPAGAH